MKTARLLTLGLPFLALGLIPSVTLGAGDAAPSREALDFFETRVRPVLANRCWGCHGPEKQKAGLRLDSREAVLKGGDQGPAVTPGNPDDSLLVEAIRHADANLKMPPNGKLDPSDVEALTDWVRAGAAWPADRSAAGPVVDPARTHWAFRPVKDPNPPSPDSAWAIHPIDAFILEKLHAAGLEPSPRADKRTLLRRLTFDLTGLPPTEAEMDEFLRDESPDAYARVVDRLLASPRYGERWGRHWLDVARYADTKGYVFTAERRYAYAYTYRDYVIRSLNEDLPYDRFLTEQIAADALNVGADTSPLAALGFLTVGRRFLNDNNEIIDDRIDVVSRGTMGLTVSCARCHDHKFDPIPTEDYYSLYGVFASSIEPNDLPELKSPTVSPHRAEFDKARQAAQTKVEDHQKTVRAAIDAEVRGKFADYFVAAVQIEFNSRGPKLDAEARARKLMPERLRGVAGRFRRLLDAGANTPVPPAWTAWKTLQAIPEDRFTSLAEPLSAMLDEAFADPTVSALTVPPPCSREELHRRFGEIVAQAIKSTTPDLAALRSAAIGPDGWLAFPDMDINRVFNRAERDKLNRLRADVARIEATHPGAPSRAMVLVDSPNPVEPRVFVRGNPGRPGKAIPRRFLKLLSPPERPAFTHGSGRLDLARAIVARDNPLTARVFVNRVWMGHFGEGLVRSPSDFGTRSDPPSHPELLDWLASRFVHEDNWSIKSLHRRIVLSNTYQQTSLAGSEGLERDPSNLLLWRQNRRRLDYESMRDAVLAAAGTLDPTMGGQPIPLFGAENSKRRTIYGFIDRQNLEGIYRTFDFPSPDASAPRRISTTVPQQALFLMNSPFLAENAQALSRSIPGEAAEPRIQTLYRRVLGRSATDREVEIGKAFLQAADRDAIDRLFGSTMVFAGAVTLPTIPRRSNTPPAPALSSWDAYAQALLMTNEFHFLD